jgi:hypothetical protein
MSMHLGSYTLAALVAAIAVSTSARAETSCDLANVPKDKVVTVRGKIKSIDVDRGDKSYWVVIELKDRCGTTSVNVSTKQDPRCRVGANLSVTGPYQGGAEPLIDAQRVACVR